MPHDRIEFEDPRYSTCECCGQTSTHLVRFVSRNDKAFAVYYADFSTGHDYVSVLASFGDWADGAGPDNRRAFAMTVWVSEDSYQVSLVDAADSGYIDGGVMGRILDRCEALEHPWKSEAFKLSDHIVECDQPVVQFLESTTQANRKD
jgi:hypothetical protein